MNIDELKKVVLSELENAPCEVADLEKKIGYPKVLTQQAIFDLLAANKVQLNIYTKVLSLK